MIDEFCENLSEALVATYRPYVVERLAGVEGVAGLDDALTQGAAWLESALQALFSKPYVEQPRGPLELFQQALEFPTNVIELAGGMPVERDEVAVAALPGDLFGLAPASSRDLGDVVWEAHMRWGVAKASAMTAG